MRTILNLALTTALLGTMTSLQAQSPPKMVFVDGGAFRKGGGYQYEIQDWRMHVIGQDTNFDRINANSYAIGEEPAENNPNMLVTVNDFYISEQEISNEQYRAFLVDSLLSDAEFEAFQRRLNSHKKNDSLHWKEYEPIYEKAIAAGLMPTERCWSDDFKYGSMDPYTQYYFRHPAFNGYPVVGVSWHQANAYCEWLTNAENKELLRKGKPLIPAYRLPTEAEWEYAAVGRTGATSENAPSNLYPWEGRLLWDSHGKFRANIKTGVGDYIGDDYSVTAPVKSFEPNSLGLYNMAGNVSEWTQDAFRLQVPYKGDNGHRRGARDSVEELNLAIIDSEEALEKEKAIDERVIKGGSWADYHQAAYCGSRAGLDGNRGYSRVGFRVAQIKLGSPW